MPSVLVTAASLDRARGRFLAPGFLAVDLAWPVPGAVTDRRCGRPWRGRPETRRDLVVTGLAQHDTGDRRPLAVDPADGPEGEAAAGHAVRASLDADKPVVPEQCVGVVHGAGDRQRAEHLSARRITPLTARGVGGRCGSRGRGRQHLVAEGSDDRGDDDERAGDQEPGSPTVRCSCWFAAGHASIQGSVVLPARMWFSIYRRYVSAR